MRSTPLSIRSKLMEYTLIRSTRKTLALQIDIRGSLIVRAPMRYPESKIVEFIDSKITWIKKHQERKKIQMIQEESEKWYYRLFWEKYLLEWKNTDEIIMIYKNSLRKYLDTRISELAFGKTMKRKIAKIRISSARTRWGSCSSQWNLSFSYRLALYPKTAIDAVIIHELAHLSHANHSKKFWDLVYEWMPEYEEKIALLSTAPMYM